ncbi:MAG: hypothetical protein ACFCA4_13385 [Cyanophyceae cyanobacterium]
MSRDKAIIEASVREGVKWDFDPVAPEHTPLWKPEGKPSFRRATSVFLGRSPLN